MNLKSNSRRKGTTVCWNCEKERERCRAASVTVEGEVEWICPKCWKELEYDKYLYDHRLGVDSDAEC